MTLLIRYTLQVEMKFGNVGLWRAGKTGVHGEKPLGVRKITNNSFYVCFSHGVGLN